jgi:hypothetical protein
MLGVTERGMLRLLVDTRQTYFLTVEMECLFHLSHLPSCSVYAIALPNFSFESTISRTMNPGRLALTLFLFSTTSLIQANDVSRHLQGSVANDVCIKAVPFALNSTVSVNITSATIDSSEVPTNCFDNNLPQYPGIWYSFVGTGAQVTARSCNADYTYISVYKGSCGATNLQCVAGSTNACARERFFFNTVKGTTYYVLLQSYYEAVVDLSIFVPSPVANDNCINAIPLAINSTVSVDTTYATSDSLGVPANCVDNALPTDPGVWYSFVGTGAQFTARSCNTAYTYISTGTAFTPQAIGRLEQGESLE